MAILRITSSEKLEVYRKYSIRPRMGICQTPTLTGYLRKEYTSRTTWNCLFPRNDEISPKTRPEIQQDLSF